MAKYKLQHIGYPIAGRPIEESEWKDYSKHSTLKAAIKKMDKCTDHLQNNQWDDHYRFIDVSGIVLTPYDIEQERWNWNRN